MESVLVKNENTLKQLESFDFKAPVKVTVILDESDDEDGLIPDIKKENTNKESSTRISNVEENGCVSNIDILVTNNKVKKENKTPYDNNADLSEYLHFKTPEHAPNNSTSDCNNPKKSGELTRVNDNNDPKISSDKNDKISTDKINDESIPTSKATEEISVIMNDNNKTDPKNDYGETNHLKSLLETVADNLLIIIEAYNYHLRLRSDNKTDRYTLDASLANFFRIKLHFFNLSFCTVLVLIIPQEKNDSFHTKFLLDVIKRAQSKKGINIPYQLTRDLYFELITWSKTKPEYINNLTTQLQAKNNVQIQNDNSNSHLKYQLNNRPFPLTNTADVYQNSNHLTGIGGVVTHSNKTDSPVTSIHTPTSSYEAQPKFPPQNDSFTRCNYNHAQSEVDKASTLSHTNQSTNGTGNHMPNSTMYKELSKILNTNSTNNSRKRSGTSGKKQPPSKSSKANPKSHQTCIFTAGPPGRQISLNVEQNELNSNQVPTNFNVVYSNFIASRDLNNVKPPPPQAQYGTHDVGPRDYQRAPNSSKQMHLPQNQYSNVFHQCRGNTIPQTNYKVLPPPYPSGHWQHDISTLAQQNLSPKQPQPQNEQAYGQNVLESTRPVFAQQNLSAKQPQPQFQNEQAYGQNVLESSRPVSAFAQQNFSAKQPQPQFQNEQAYGQNVLESSRPVSAFVQQNLSAKQPQPQFQNEQAYVQNVLEYSRPVSAFAQQNLSAKQPQPQFQNEQAYVQNVLESSRPVSAFAQQNLSAKQPQPQFQNEQAYVQNVLESTRSVSTDSGFTSPLHFNNSTEEMGNTNKEEEAQSNILITHVTSLNPNATFIKEDMCHVCGKGTSKMCLGCYRTYYCSAECQKSDWYLHRQLCKKT